MIITSLTIIESICARASSFCRSSFSSSSSSSFSAQNCCRHHLPYKQSYWRGRDRMASLERNPPIKRLNSGSGDSIGQLEARLIVVETETKLPPPPPPVVHVFTFGPSVNFHSSPTNQEPRGSPLLVINPLARPLH